MSPFVRVYKGDDMPLYIQAADAVRARIADGSVRPGDRLPSVRRLSDELGVNPATVVAAYRILSREGLLDMRRGSGVYVSEDARAQDAQSGASKALKEPTQAVEFDLSASVPPEDSYPLDDVKRYLVQAVDMDGGAAFSYQEAGGYPPLRKALARELARAFGLGVDAADVHVVSGAQQGLDLAARVLLRHGDLALVEAPGYQGAGSAFLAAGARVEAVEAGAGGLDLDAIERAATERPLRLLYVNPTLQNPSCAVYPEDFRECLVRLAQRHGFFIIEDDLMVDLAEQKPRPLRSYDATGKVLYLKSFSKSLMPGLRIAVLEAPPAMRERLESAKRAIDLSSNGLIQRVLTFILNDGRYAEHLASVRKRYEHACDEFCRGLSDAAGLSWERPAGGLNVWLELPAGLSGSAAAGACRSDGILVAPEAEFRSDAGARDAHLRLSFRSVRLNAAGEAGSRVARALSAAIAATGRGILARGR